MSKKLRVAIVGCGGQGNTHSRAYSLINNVQVVGVCDIDENRAKSLAQKYDAKVYSDYLKMFDELKPDLVSVTTKEYDHTAPATAALERKINVYCEKMMAHSLEAGRNMVEAARKNGAVLGVGYNYRFIPSVAWLRRMIDSGKLGDVVLVNAFVHSYCHHHSIDICRFLCGKVKEVTASVLDNPSQMPYPWRNQHELLYVPSVNSAACLRFENGALAVITATIHRSLDILMDIQCVGTKARTSFSKMSFSNVLGDVESFPAIEGEDLSFSKVSDRTFAGTFNSSIKAFVEALREGKRPSTTGEDGLDVMRIENAIVESQRYGCAVRL